MSIDLKSLAAGALIVWPSPHLQRAVLLKVRLFQHKIDVLQARCSPD